MNWLLSKLAAPLIAPALLAGLLLSAGGIGLTWWHLHQANGTIAALGKSISSLTAERDAARLLTAQTEKADSDFHAQVEKDRADFNAEALRVRKAMEAQIAALTSKVSAAEAARRKASTQLLDTLHAIPVEQQNALSPAVRDALRRVRDAQAADAAAAAATAAGGGQDNNRIPTPAPP